MLRATPHLASSRAGLAILVSLPLLLYLAWEFAPGPIPKLVRLGLMGMVAAIAGIGIFVRPREGILFLIFYIYAGLGFLMPGPVAMMITAALFVAAFLGMARGETFRSGDPLLWWAIGLFTVLALQSMVFAYDLDLAASAFSKWIKCALLVFLALQFVRSPEDLRRMGHAVFLGALATIVFGLLALKLGLKEDINYIGGVQLVRFTGVHPNPNRAASFMCTALPLGLFAVKYASGWRRVLYALGTLTIIVGMFSTLSRGVIFPFAVVVLAVVLREVRSRRMYVALIVLLVIGIMFTPRFYWDRVTSLTQFTGVALLDWSLYIRKLALETAWELSRDHPWTGVGIGNFTARCGYKLFYRVPAHNSYLEVLVDTGIVGLAAFMTMLALGVRHAVAGARRRWRNAPPYMQSLAFYFLLSLVVALISAAFDSLPYRYVIWPPLVASVIVGDLARRDEEGTLASSSA